MGFCTRMWARQLKHQTVVAAQKNQTKQRCPVFTKEELSSPETRARLHKNIIRVKNTMEVDIPKEIKIKGTHFGLYAPTSKLSHFVWQCHRFTFHNVLLTSRILMCWLELAILLEEHNLDHVLLWSHFLVGWGISKMPCHSGRCEPRSKKY